MHTRYTKWFECVPSLVSPHVDRHVNLDSDFWVDQDDSPPTPQLELFAEAGDVVMFDMRLRHRGRGNKSSKNRPIGYLGYARMIAFMSFIHFREDPLEVALALELMLTRSNSC